MSQVGRVHEVVCMYIIVFLQSERRKRQHSSAYVAAAIVWQS